jgi:sporulation protein YlmC with PRC-barrel domain
MLMTTVAAFVLAAPVAAQDQGKPAAAQELQKAPQEQAAGQTGTADQPAAAAQDQPAEAAPGAPDQPPAMSAEGGTAAPDDAMTAEEAPVEQDVDVAEEAAETPPADMEFLKEQKAEQFLAADEVIGAQVVNSGDEEVGEIADLVMDPDQKLVGVVLSVGGFLGIGEKWVAVPVDSIQFPTKDQPARLLVAVTKDQLENAPDFVTRDTVEAQQAADQAQQQMQQQQMQPVPAPTATTTQ